MSNGSNFNLVTEKVKFQPQKVAPNTDDTRQFRECPGCNGASEYTYWMDIPGAMVTEPCACCDGEGEVLDGIGFDKQAREWQVWVWGQMNWADSEQAARKMYRENLIAFRKHWERVTQASQEIPF